MFSFLAVSWDEVVGWLTGDGIRVLIIVVVAIWMNFVLRRTVPRALRVAITRQMEGQPQEEIDQRVHTLEVVITGTGRAIIGLVALIMILPIVGIPVSPLLASIGIAGLAIGFGAQSLVKDVISGLFIIADNQYSKGDVVTVGGMSGLVEDVGIRRTVLRDLDGIVHYIPNGEISVASNFTQEYSRVNLNVGVAYGEDLDRVMAVIDQVGEEMARDPKYGPMVITPPKSLRVDNLGDSSVDIKIVGDTKPIKQWEVTGELRKRLKQAFDEQGIEIPFPHRVLVTSGAKATDVSASGNPTISGKM